MSCNTRSCLYLRTSKFQPVADTSGLCGRKPHLSFSPVRQRHDRKRSRQSGNCSDRLSHAELVADVPSYLSVRKENARLHQDARLRTDQPTAVFSIQRALAARRDGAFSAQQPLIPLSPEIFPYATFTTHSLDIAIKL